MMSHRNKDTFNLKINQKLDETLIKVNQKFT